MMDVLGHFREGVARYRARDWDGALKSFRKSHKANPGDKLAADYIERCEIMKATPQVKTGTASG